MTGVQTCALPIFVVYFGKKRWKAARKMDDLFLTEIFPEELKKLFTEKPLLIFEMCHFPNEEWFQTDLRQVCGFLKRTNDRMKLRAYIEENQEVFSNLPEDAYDLLTVMAGIRNLRLLKQEVQTNIVVPNRRILQWNGAESELSLF